MKRLALISFAALMVACGSSDAAAPRIGTGGVGGASGTGGSGGSSVSAEVEAVCRDYCSNERDPICSFRKEWYDCVVQSRPSRCSRDEVFTGEPCLDSCIVEHEANPCGKHQTAKKACELELDCNDEFNDCQIHEDEGTACFRELDDVCNDCSYITVAGAVNLGDPDCYRIGVCPSDGTDPFECSLFTSPPEACGDSCPNGNADCGNNAFCFNGICTAQCSAEDACDEGLGCAQSLGKCV
jgi:hypothetical protein